jgi:hypothetical protein
MMSGEETVRWDGASDHTALRNELDGGHIQDGASDTTTLRDELEYDHDENEAFHIATLQDELKTLNDEFDGKFSAATVMKHVILEDFGDQGKYRSVALPLFIACTDGSQMSM